jgi:hypothetical protein
VSPPVAFLDFLNSREKAMLIWTIVLLAFLVPVVVVKAPSVFRDLAAILRTLFGSKLVVPLGSAAVYSAAVVYLASRLNLWHTTATKETAYWFFGTGVILVGHAIEWAEDRAVFKRLLRQGLKLTIIVEFLANVYVFPLAAEMVLIPVVSIFAIAEVAAEIAAARDPSQATGRKFISAVLTTVGFGLLIYVMVSAITDLNGFLTRENAEDFLIGPALTIALMPLLYGIVLWVRQEMKNLRKRFYPSFDSPA